MQNNAAAQRNSAPALPAKPQIKPSNPRFSSGPTSKRPGWSLDALKGFLHGRSHRSKEGKAKLQQVIELTRETLSVPADYKIGITAASDTGAVEMAMWNLLGPRPVDVMAWEAFGKDWITDVLEELKVAGSRKFFPAQYGQLPDLTQYNPAHDLVFTWNGTTSGARAPNADWIPENREGLAICDATSAVYAMPMPWDKLDVVTYSWQKVLGGEGQHGMIILSPRAIARLESHTPSWPLPKIYKLTKKGKVNEAFFTGEVINTCSMLCVEDALDALQWVKAQGGAPAMEARTNANFKIMADWVAKTSWIDFLAAVPETRSTTSVCLSFVDPAIAALNDEGKAAFAKRVVALLEKEQAALDAASYRDAPPGLRLWLGATVESADVAAVLPWIEWAFAIAKAELK